MVFAMEIFGGCTRSSRDEQPCFVQTLRQFAKEIAEVSVPGDPKADGVAKQRHAVGASVDDDAELADT